MSFVSSFLYTNAGEQLAKSLAINKALGVAKAPKISIDLSQKAPNNVVFFLWRLHKPLLRTRYENTCSETFVKH